MIVFHNKDHGRLIGAAIPRMFNPACDPVVSHVGKDGELLGGVIYDNFTGGCIFMHQAGFTRKWLSRDLLWVCFHYAFEQLGCNRVCGTIPSNNQRLLDFNRRLGFTLHSKIEEAYPDGDLLVLSMRRDECRWLNLKPRGLQAGSA